MRRGSIAFEKLVKWVLGGLLAVVILYFLINQFSPNKQGVVHQLIALLGQAKSP